MDLLKYKEDYLLILLFFLLSYFFLGGYFNHEIAHAYPLGHLANDNFNFLAYSNSLQERGIYDYYQPFISGGFNDTIAFHPPLVHYLTVLLSNTNKINTYDSIIIISFLFTFAACLLFYFLIKKMHSGIALLSIPFMTYIFADKFLFKVSWGQFPFILGAICMIFFFWALSYIQTKKFFIILSLSITGTILAHTSEFIFEMLFLVIFFVWLILSKQLNRKIIKTIILAGLISFPLSVYYLFIFYKTFMKFRPYKFSIIPLSKMGGMRFLAVKDINILFLILISVGIILALRLWKKQKFYPFLVSYAIILFSFTNYIGFGKRAVETRSFWPIYLSIFFGYGLYIIMSTLKDKINIKYAAAIISTILIIAFSFQNSLSSPGSIAPKPFYEGLSWIKDNTPENSTVFFGWNQFIGQSSLGFEARRVSYLQNSEDLFNKIRKGIQQYNDTKVDLIFEFASNFAYWKTPFKIGYHLLENKTLTQSIKPLCFFDYLLIPLFDREKSIISYNKNFAQALMSDNKFNKVFFNGAVIILESDKGEYCEHE